MILISRKGLLTRAIGLGKEEEGKEMEMEL